MSATGQKWKIIDFIGAFFPLQLIVAHIKYNLVSIFFWSILFMIVSDKLGYSFGIPFLFLSPEYLGEVNAWSFTLMGFALGGFTMGFNTYSYIKLGPHFPFLTTLSKPFFKFCLNNALIPLLFIGFYLYKMISFQAYEELASFYDIALYIIGLFSGSALFFTLSFFYFFRVAKKDESEEIPHEAKPISSVIFKEERWFDRFKRNKEKTFLYIGKNLKFIQSRSLKHFDQELVEKVFAKNRINASVFELATISMFLILGAFNSYKILEVPAAISIILLLTIFLMLFSALHSWFKGWVYPLLIITLFGMNQLSHHTGMFNYTSYAYGLNYDASKLSNYSITDFREVSNDVNLNDSTYNCYLQTLENWKAKTGEEKPKLVIINTSGGGSRSALWTMIVLQKSDEYLGGELSKHIQLITGASGGMIGAAYYRELLLRSYKGEIESPNTPKYSENIGKDMLNRLSFMASTNDLFIRYQKHEYNGIKYTKDRGYAFEEQLHENTDNMLRHNLGYYTYYEQSGIIPTMIFSPTIINDGRRLLISSQKINFLTESYNGLPKLSMSNENIEFHSLLKNQQTNQIRFSTVLRANATFPFVLPMVTLPTKPETQLMDAGIRDNYGGKTMMQFLFVMENWIRENTSGVVVVQIRDTKRVLDNQVFTQVSFIDKITLPFGNMYKNFPKVQDFNQEELVNIGVQAFDFPVDLITFNLKERREERISLSWHLTKQEKLKIEKAFDSDQNRNSLSQLKRAL